MSFANAHSQRLKALHKVKHVLQGEDPTILLLARNQETGAIDVELASLSTQWSKSRVRPEFLGSGNDEVMTFVEVFEVSESLPAALAGLVAAVRHGTELFKVKINAKPSGLQRYWRFEIMSVEESPAEVVT